MSVIITEAGEVRVEGIRVTYSSPDIRELCESFVDLESPSFSDFVSALVFNLTKVGFPPIAVHRDGFVSRPNSRRVH